VIIITCLNSYASSHKSKNPSPTTGIRLIVCTIMAVLLSHSPYRVLKILFFSCIKCQVVSIIVIGHRSPLQEDCHVELQTASISGSVKASQEADNILILQKLPKQPKYLQV